MLLCPGVNDTVQKIFVNSAMWTEVKWMEEVGLHESAQPLPTLFVGLYPFITNSILTPTTARDRTTAISNKCAAQVTYI